MPCPATSEVQVLVPQKANTLQLIKLVLSAAAHKAHMVVVVRGSNGDLALASNPLYMISAGNILESTVKSWSDALINAGDSATMLQSIEDMAQPSTLDLDKWFADLDKEDIEQLLKEVQHGHGPGSEDLPQT